MIAADIYAENFKDETLDSAIAEKLGLPLGNYQSRRETLLEFLADNEFTEAAYLIWLREKNNREAQLLTPITEPQEAAWDVTQPSRGFGDTVAKMTSAMGIKPCGGCKKRQKAFNKVVKYKG